MRNPLRIKYGVQITWLNRHMFDWQWALGHCDDHAALLTGVQVSVRSVLRHEHGFSCLERSMIVTNNNNALALPAEHDLIGHGMTMKAVLLTWFKAVDVAMELIGLPDPLPHKSAWGKLLDCPEIFLLHGHSPRRLVAREFTRASSHRV